MPRKWRNRIITRCSSNVNVTISVSKTLLELDLVTSIQRVVQCCHLASPNLKNSHVPSNNFHVSVCFHSPRKEIRILYNLNAPRICPWPRTKALISHIQPDLQNVLLLLRSQHLPKYIDKCFPLPEGLLLFIFPAVCNQSYNKITRLIPRPPFSLDDASY